MLENILKQVPSWRILHDNGQRLGCQENLLELNNARMHPAQSLVQNFPQYTLADDWAPLHILDSYWFRSTPVPAKVNCTKSALTQKLQGVIVWVIVASPAALRLGCSKPIEKTDRRAGQAVKRATPGQLPDR